MAHVDNTDAASRAADLSCYLLAPFNPSCLATVAARRAATRATVAAGEAPADAANVGSATDGIIGQLGNGIAQIEHGAAEPLGEVRNISIAIAVAIAFLSVAFLAFVIYKIVS